MHLQNTVTESTSLKLWNKHILEIVEQYFSSLTNNFLNSDDIFPCMSREKRWQDRRLISSWANGRIEKWFQILINSNFEVLDRSTSLKLLVHCWSALSAAFVLPCGALLYKGQTVIVLLYCHVKLLSFPMLFNMLSNHLKPSWDLFFPSQFEVRWQFCFWYW